MRRGLLSALAVVVAAATVELGMTSPAWACGISCEYTTTHASASGNQITLRAQDVRSLQPGWKPGSDSSGSSGDASHPICTYFPAGPVATKLLGKGGASPGAWYLPSCKWPKHYYGNPMPAIWIVGPPPAAPTNPTFLVQQAVAHLTLDGPRIGMSPPSNRPQIVNVSTWLWISGGWRGRSVTATAGRVTATATAVPYKVVWNMGDGRSVTCRGPGTEYKSNEPASAQSTTCSYTYSKPSSTVPGGRFTVTATVYYQVTWVARGAPGGGNLGLVAGPTARTTVLVEQAEALNTSSGG
jgi:hypothetical protein